MTDRPRREPATEGGKWCNGCEMEKPVDDFAPHPYGSLGRTSRCRPCETKRHQLRRHGVTAADKAAIADSQGGCAICHRPTPGGKGWVMDHDRSCCPGEQSCEECRRGVLCQWCNSMLGYAHDNPRTLKSAIEYLFAHDSKRFPAMLVDVDPFDLPPIQWADRYTDQGADQ